MEFVNPIGRSASNGIHPMACTCSTGMKSYRSNSDSCLHCGCGCDSRGAYRTGNRVKSVKTLRAS